MGRPRTSRYSCDGQKTHVRLGPNPTNTYNQTNVYSACRVDAVSWKSRLSSAIKLRDPDRPPLCHHINQWATSSSSRSIPVLPSHKAAGPEPLRAVSHRYEAAIKNTLKVSVARRVKQAILPEAPLSRPARGECPAAIVNRGEGLRLPVVHHVQYILPFSGATSHNG